MASSSSTSSRASTGRQLGSGEQQAPVPYKVGPYAYSLPVTCSCNLMAPRWTAWSDENPDRRYYRCPYAMTPRDCGFYRWIDRKATEHERTLLCDMRDAIRQLKREEEKEEQRVQLAQRQLSEQMQVIHQLEKEKDEMKNKMEIELKEARKKTRSNICLTYILVVVVGLCFGLVYTKL